jgi:hypothetical protein
MKNTFEHVKLLDAALVDESWESCSARLRNEGLASLRARRRIRARCVNGGQIAALLVFVAGVWFSFHAAPITDRNRASELRGQEAANPASIRDERVEVAATQAGGRETSRDKETYITEEQMLAMFPQGSCVVAEINGEKQLVVFENLESAKARLPGETKPDSKMLSPRRHSPGRS